MSSQRGNANRSRPQKNQNERVYKKDLYGTTPHTKFLDTFKVEGLCPRCTRVIEWKLKYNKYKKLTVPGKCATCTQKTVKEAYHNLCRPCAEESGKCPKCCQPHATNPEETVALEPKKLSTSRTSKAHPRTTGEHSSADSGSDPGFSDDDSSEND